MKMETECPTDYETYKQIMNELLLPICEEGLDLDTLKRLYESKWVYLENLRIRCFLDMNRISDNTLFTISDYRLILEAQKKTSFQLRHLIITALVFAEKQAI